MNVTSLIMHLSMIKAAQQQEQLALQLIQSAVENAGVTDNRAQSPPETSPPQETAPSEGEQKIDIRV